MKRLNNLKPDVVKEHIYRIAFSTILLMFVVLLFSILRRSIFGPISSESHVYFEIVLLLLLAVLAEVSVYYLKQQSVLILMVLGILISASSLGLIWEGISHVLPFPLPTDPPTIIVEENIIHVFAQLGAIILLFKVGLHSAIERIFAKENLFVALAGTIFPFSVGYAYAYFTGGSFAYSMFVAAALCATSVGVTVAILKQMNVISTKFSQVIIGAAVIDDILALLVLAFVVNIVHVTDNPTTSIAFTFISALVFIIGAIASGKYLLGYLDRWEMGKKRFMLTLAYMLFLAYVAEMINLSAIVGAFLAGLILSKSRHRDIIEKETYGLEFIFTPIFFISLGLLVDVSAIIQYWIPIVMITLIAILSKIIACGGVSAFFRVGKIESLIIGFGMVPRGEVALIIASIGLTNKILPASEYSVISAMALLTSFIIPSVLQRLIRKVAN